MVDDITNREILEELSGDIFFYVPIVGMILYTIAAFVWNFNFIIGSIWLFPLYSVYKGTINKIRRRREREEMLRTLDDINRNGIYIDHHGSVIDTDNNINNMINEMESKYG